MNFFQSLFGGSPSIDLKSVIHKNTFLVDVREPSEFSMGSVKGAVNIPLGTIPSQLSKFKNKDNIVVFCRSGNRSRQAQHFLEQSGITNVVNGGTWEQVQQFVN